MSTLWSLRLVFAMGIVTLLLLIACVNLAGKWTLTVVGTGPSQEELEGLRQTLVTCDGKGKEAKAAAFDRLVATALVDERVVQNREQPGAQVAACTEGTLALVGAHERVLDLLGRCAIEADGRSVAHRGRLAVDRRDYIAVFQACLVGRCAERDRVDVVALWRIDDQARLAFEHPVTVEFLTEDEYAAQSQVDEGALTDLDREMFDESASVLQALGLVPPGTDLLDTSNAMMESGTLAFSVYEDGKYPIPQPGIKKDREY